jgi:hypothetical protein
MRSVFTRATCDFCFARFLRFQYWELVGREKERIRQIFHDDVFSPILTAVFAITAAKDATNTAQQTEFLQRASDLQGDGAHPSDFATGAGCWQYVVARIDNLSLDEDR